MSATGKTSIGVYRHYKGQYYRVIGEAQHSETEERVVMYQALYGDKGFWVRPASMFHETVLVEGVKLARFDYLDPQIEVLEQAVLDVKQGEELAFQAAFKKAQLIISSMHGYINHSLSRCIENSSRYLLLVHWETLEDHNIGFRKSVEYQEWKKLLHHFYDPFPIVEHFERIDL